MSVYHEYEQVSMDDMDAHETPEYEMVKRPVKVRKTVFDRDYVPDEYKKIKWQLDELR